MRPFSFIFIVLIASLFVEEPARAQDAPKPGAAPPGAVVKERQPLSLCGGALRNPKLQGDIFLENDGSANASGYCYAVSRSGEVISTTGTTGKLGERHSPDASPLKGSIPAALAEKLFRDATTAMPLSKLPPTRCIKSVSFGAARYLLWNGEKSPDLCGQGNLSILLLQQDYLKVTQSVVWRHK